MVPFLFMIIVKKRTMSINAYPHRTGSINDSINNYVRRRELNNLAVISEWMMDVIMESESNEYDDEVHDHTSDDEVQEDMEFQHDHTSSVIDEVEDMDYECSTLYDFKVLDASLDCSFS